MVRCGVDAVCKQSPSQRNPSTVVQDPKDSPLAAAHVRDVLHNVSHPLLRLQLVGGAREDLQKRVEAPGRGGVAEDGVAEAVGEDALA